MPRHPPFGLVGGAATSSGCPRQRGGGDADDPPAGSTEGSSLTLREVLGQSASSRIMRLRGPGRLSLRWVIARLHPLESAVLAEDPCLLHLGAYLASVVVELCARNSEHFRSVLLDQHSQQGLAAVRHGR
jgi:hypothetical protein